MTSQQIDPQAFALNAVTMGRMFDMQVQQAAPGSRAVVAIELSLTEEELHFCFEHAVIHKVE